MKAMAWVRENLFNGVFNSILTLVTLALLYVSLKSIVYWALHEAKWSVVPDNMRLLMVGPFPPEQVWRIWAMLVLTLFVAGLWYGNTTRARPPLWMWVGAPVVYALVWPVVFPSTRFWLALALLALPGGMLLGPYVPRKWLVPISLAAFGVILALPTAVNPNQWGGFFLTVLITIAVSLMAFPFGLLLALGRTGKLPVFRTLSILYIELIRGVPLVTVLFLSWIMVPLFVPEQWRLPDLVSVSIGFSMFAAAYLAEYVRGGIQGVPKGQYEAAWALGLSGSQSARYIILPQAIRSVIPALIGQEIAIFKDTSLVYILGLFDLLYMALTVTKNPKYLGTDREVLLFVMFVYFVGAALMSYASRKLERAMGLGTR
ncbi:amino acid ABC transporter permease [Oceanithermus sp.]|uniref:amino acid ABC transporter permease n=1 Tax=Oceanithermus sp. TaxID=2268145 RepID=UPI0025F68EB6|nr:amino acid ABC transporter permease [Oceanithermus sp.]